jgi:hypothetical protein
MHLSEVATLKVKVQSLKNENVALKPSCTSTNITSMNLDKFVGQKSSNKLGLRYKKSFKTSNFPKSKENNVKS